MDKPGLMSAPSFCFTLAGVGNTGSVIALNFCSFAVIDSATVVVSTFGYSISAVPFSSETVLPVNDGDLSISDLVVVSTERSAN